MGPDLFLNIDEVISKKCFEEMIQAKEIFIANIQDEIVGYITFNIKEKNNPSMRYRKQLKIDTICVNDSQWLISDYNKKEMYDKFDTYLRKIDEEYRTTLVNFGQSKYFIINFTMAKLMEMEQTDRNKVALYLFNTLSNSIKLLA